MPPWNCWQVCTTSLTSSPVSAFSIDTSCTTSWPCVTRQAQWYRNWRAARVLASSIARRWRTACLSHSVRAEGLAVAHVLQRELAAPACSGRPPSRPARCARSGSSSSPSEKPWCSSPSRLPAGMRQSSNTSSAVSDEQPAGLVERAADAEARRALLDDEHRDRVPRLAGARGDEVQVGVHAVGDEQLAAVEHPRRVAVAARPRACGCRPRRTRRPAR